MIHLNIKNLKGYQKKVCNKKAKNYKNKYCAMWKWKKNDKNLGYKCKLQADNKCHTDFLLDFFIY